MIAKTVLNVFIFLCFLLDYHQVVSSVEIINTLNVTDFYVGQPFTHRCELPNFQRREYQMYLNFFYLNFYYAYFTIQSKYKSIKIKMLTLKNIFCVFKLLKHKFLQKKVIPLKTFLWM